MLRNRSLNAVMDAKPSMMISVPLRAFNQDDVARFGRMQLARRPIAEIFLRVLFGQGL